MWWYGGESGGGGGVLVVNFENEDGSEMGSVLKLKEDSDVLWKEEGRREFEGGDGQT